MFDVAVDMEAYHEMRVDVGVIAQAFLYPTAAFALNESIKAIPVRVTLQQ